MREDGIRIQNRSCERVDGLQIRSEEASHREATPERVNAANGPVSPALVKDDPVIDLLVETTSRAGLETESSDLASIQRWLREEMVALHDAMAITMSDGDDLSHRAAAHLLQCPGKRIRPLCVILAARMGGRPFDDTVVDLAVACELVHTATLLHDDVLDQGEERRGVTTARLVYGNAASVLGGDHLLVEAMQRVRRSGFIDLLGSLMDTLSEMISAEAIQLAHRGGFEPDKQVYMRIVRGKTASLFRWALEAGATAGGLSSEACVNVMNMGESLGIAFQLVDDVLDLDGDPHVTGKDAWVDLSEGKFTWPLIVATEADPDLVGFLKEVAENPSMMEDATLARALRSRIVATGALEVTRTLALSYAEAARESLRKLPDHRVVQALEAVIDGCIHRIR